MGEKERRQALPEMNEIEENVDDGVPYLLSDGYQVASWRPGPARSDVPCTQVHVILPLANAGRLVLRLKSARALDELVGVLLAHRKDVWGEEPTS